ncbi:SGNH/GDSL hydrolase family protein [Endozoicomonas arenosclerae]|uniref:SGNH/GDSL hydrolase family protein n=1 Tax=Endozoicomonas arenosclerae TaxID=1633495 RepID=UPI000782B1F1|nr:SGNH/GDSL hydrolase family protein [Endozoicomonas arenosclerae]
MINRRSLPEKVSDHLLWWGGLSMLPVLAAQGMKVRRTILRLPPAGPPFFGSSKGGDKDFYLYVTGESSAAGVGALTHSKALSGCLADRLSTALDMNVRWRAIGKNGIKAEELRRDIFPATLLPALKDGRADLIVIALGVNDAKGVTPRKQWRRDVCGMISDIRLYSQTPILLAGLPPVQKFSALPSPLSKVLGARARLLDRDLARIAEQWQGVLHMPMSGELDVNNLARDGFHPSEKGYALWAESLASGYLADLNVELEEPSL